MSEQLSHFLAGRWSAPPAFQNPHYLHSPNNTQVARLIQERFDVPNFCPTSQEMDLFYICLTNPSTFEAIQTVTGAQPKYWADSGPYRLVGLSKEEAALHFLLWRQPNGSVVVHTLYLDGLTPMAAMQTDMLSLSQAYA